MVLMQLHMLDGAPNWRLWSSREDPKHAYGLLSYVQGLVAEHGAS